MQIENIVGPVADTYGNPIYAMNTNREDLVHICGTKRRGKTVGFKYLSQANSEASYDGNKR